MSLLNELDYCARIHKACNLLVAVINGKCDKVEIKKFLKNEGYLPENEDIDEDFWPCSVCQMGFVRNDLVFIDNQRSICTKCNFERLS